jgi:hypothetical protein
MPKMLALCREKGSNSHPGGLQGKIRGRAPTADKRSLVLVASYRLPSLLIV